MADDPVDPPANLNAADGSNQLDAAGIDALLAEAEAANAQEPGSNPAEKSSGIVENMQQANAPLDSVETDLASAQASIDDLLKQANFEDPATSAPAVAVQTTPFDMPDFQQAISDSPASSIELLKDVELDVKIELGRSRMLVEDVLKLVEGSVVELDKLAGDPVDVFVNDRLVARGEVLVLNDNFCVRVNEILAGIREEGS
jgi:flagellar motor switch protein FliN/FliY